jgi:nickel-dependent lactate racemase
MREVKANFVLGAHKAFAYAKVAAEKEIYWVSSLTADETSLIWAKKANSVQEAVDAALAKHGPASSWAYLPEGSLVLPVPRR